MDIKKVPEIRLNEFNTEWKETTLKEFFTKVISKNNKMLYSAVFTNSAEHGIIDQRDYFDFDVANSKNIGGYYVVNPDSFVYNPRVSVTAPVGPINRNRLGYTGVVSPLYLVFTIDGINKDFLCHYYKTNKWHRYMKLTGNCGARFDRLSLSDDQFTSMPIIYPVNPKEQEAIVSYLDNLDNQISSAISRLESLKQVKAASLQAMFPEEGKDTPRVRFKGFSGAWKKAKASEIFKTFNERNHPELPVLSATQDRGMVTRESIGYNIFHDVSNEATYKRILPGQFVIHLRSFQGGFAHSEIEGIASPAYTVFGLNNETEHCDMFWKYIFMSKQFIKRLELITYGIRDGRSISYDEFCGLSFYFPEKKDEQQKIADYFINLDKQIYLQTQKLEKLKQIKSACLDKMFV